MSKYAKCDNCGAIFAELVNFPDNYTCPFCGSSSWQFDVSLEDKLKISEVLKIKTRDDPEKKPITEIKIGDELHKDTGRLHHIERIVDREHNMYVERIVDSETGEIIQQNVVPLSEHQGFGAAKKKNAPES